MFILDISTDTETNKYLPFHNEEFYTGSMSFIFDLKYFPLNTKITESETVAIFRRTNLNCKKIDSIKNVFIQLTVAHMLNTAILA